MGRAEGDRKLSSAKNLLPSDHVANIDDGEEAGNHLEVLHTASFEELASKNVQYDTIIWFSISLLLVLAWGIGIIMLLYLPFRRYVLQKEIESRKLYVTPKEIVYEVTRPSFIPFLGDVKIRKHVPLFLVIDIIIEQGCLQSVYGLHTFRVESIAYGNAAPLDELQVQGVSNPGLLRKIIIAQASKSILISGRACAPSFHMSGCDILSRMDSWTLGPAVLRSPSTTAHKGWKRLSSPCHAWDEPKGIVPMDSVLQKLEEVNKSIKKIEFLMDKNPGPSLQNVEVTPVEAEEKFETPRIHL